MAEPFTFTEWGPYTSYGPDAATSMTVTWRSRVLSRRAWLRYGTSPGELRTIEASPAIPADMHSFTLAALTPGTRYVYEISRDPGIFRSFTTAPPPGSREPFSFTVAGDMHAYPANTIKRYFDLMLELAPDHAFGVTVGDCINDGNDPTHWDAFFRDANDYLHRKPLHNATGNHDTGNEDKYCRFLRAWRHPHADPARGAYHVVDHGNASFIFLDSSNAGGWEPTPGDEQYDWLVEQLDTRARKDRWIFLFMHHQVYSTGDFGCASIMHEVYRPLCQEYHVDAVFYGHDHHYECFWVDRDADWGGTVFFVAGAGGGQTHVDHAIMGDRDGKTKYVWPGRVLNVRKHGVPPPAPTIKGDSMGFRNDALVRDCQLLGVLEPSFLLVNVHGDEMDVRCIGWQEQVYHHLHVRRAGAGRKFDASSERVVYDP